MGGVAGHMDHLYDNPDLSFSKMKEIMTAASNAELDVEEKIFFFHILSQKIKQKEPEIKEI